MNDPCPLCNGSGRKGCLCGGTGKLAAAHSKITEMFLREKNEHEATKDALAQLQKAVLGFLFHPEFKRQDRNGFFRKYWEDKLEMKVMVSTQAAHKPAVMLPVKAPVKAPIEEWRPGQRKRYG